MTLEDRFYEGVYKAWQETPSSKSAMANAVKNFADAIVAEAVAAERAKFEAAFDKAHRAALEQYEPYILARIAEEREACAALAETGSQVWVSGEPSIAERIRARGKS